MIKLNNNITKTCFYTTTIIYSSSLIYYLLKLINQHEHIQGGDLLDLT